MNKLTKTIALGLLATTLTGTFALAGEAKKQGPLPFASFDLNKDGSISKDELTQVRAKLLAENTAAGRKLHEKGEGPSFSDVDVNHNGQISKTEFATAQAINHTDGKRGIGWEWQ